MNILISYTNHRKSVKNAFEIKKQKLFFKHYTKTTLC